MFYRVLDVRVQLSDKPYVIKYEFTTWNSVVSFLRTSIKSSNHFVYVSKVMNDLTTKFKVLHSVSQGFHSCVTCYESLNDELEGLWINSKYGDLVYEDQ